MPSGGTGAVSLVARQQSYKIDSVQFHATVSIAQCTISSSSFTCSIMEMESLVSCVMLQHLNIANNSLYGQLAHCTNIQSLSLSPSLSLTLSTDLSLFLQSVRGCYQLQSLTICGNPLTQETKYRWVWLSVMGGAFTA